MRPFFFGLALVALVACGSGSGSDSGTSAEKAAPAKPTMRGSLVAVQARVAAAEDTYDLEEIIQDLERTVGEELQGLVAGEWTKDAASLASFPAEVAVVSDSLARKWDQLGVVHDGVNHDRYHRRILELAPDLEKECVKTFFGLVSGEMEEELPDVAAMKILAEGCASIVATNPEARKYWNARMPIEVEHFVRIVSSPDSVAAYRARG